MLLRQDRRRIRKEDISGPSNFVHIAHIGWGTQQDGNHTQTDTSRASAQQIPFNQRPSSVQIIDQQNTGPRTALIPTRPPPPRPAPVRVRPAVPPPPSVERQMRSAPSKPKSLVESSREITAAANAAASTSTSDAIVSISEAAPTAPGRTSAYMTPPSTPNLDDNGINEETAPIATAAIIASVTTEAAEEILLMETADEAETPVETIYDEDETTNKLATAPICLPSLIDFPQEDTAETNELISTYSSHTANLETICLLLEADLNCSKMAREALEELVTCAICMTDRKSMALQPCGHSFCAKCPMRFEGPPVAPARTCPLCNQVFVNIVSFRL